MLTALRFPEQFCGFAGAEPNTLEFEVALEVSTEVFLVWCLILGSDGGAESSGCLPVASLTSYVLNVLWQAVVLWSILHYDHGQTGINIQVMPVRPDFGAENVN